MPSLGRVRVHTRISDWLLANLADQEMVRTNLAHKAKINQSWLSAIINRGRIPSDEVMRKLAKVVRADEDEVLAMVYADRISSVLRHAPPVVQRAMQVASARSWPENVKPPAPHRGSRVSACLEAKLSVLRWHRTDLSHYAGISEGYLYDILDRDRIPVDEKMIRLARATRMDPEVGLRILYAAKIDRIMETATPGVRKRLAAILVAAEKMAEKD